MATSAKRPMVWYSACTGWGGASESLGGASRACQANGNYYLAMRGWAQHRQHVARAASCVGGGLSTGHWQQSPAPCPEATQLGLSLCVWSLLSRQPSQSPGRVPTGESVRRPFKSTLGFRPPSSCPEGWSPCWFSGQMSWELRFPALLPQAGKPSVSLAPLSSERGYLHSRASPPDSRPPYAGGGPACFASLPIPPVWMRLLYIFSCRTSVRIVFGWFSRLIIPYFSVVTGGGEHSLRLLLHLDWNSFQGDS